MKRILVCFLAGAITASVFSGCVCASAETAANSDAFYSYNEYRENITDIADEFELNIVPENQMVFSEEESSNEISFTLDKAINCFAEIYFIPNSDSNYNSSSVGIEINGETPFDEASDIELAWRWNAGEIKTDSRGNQILSSPNPIIEETADILTDPSGRRTEPLAFKFVPGENRIKITAHTGNFTFCKMRLFGKSKLSSYSDFHNEQKIQYGESVPEDEIILEAENYDMVSSSTIIPDYDKANAATSPNDPKLLLYNIISGDRYKTSGQWIMWKFTPESSGYYKISMRARQNDKSGFTVFRKLYINNQTQFEECEAIAFDYSGSWYIKTLGDDKPYEFYFEKGRTYELRLEVTAGALSDITAQVDDLIYDLNSMYRSVVMIVGGNTDTYRDYQLKRVIPNFEEKISSLKKRTENIAEQIKNLNAGKSGNALTVFHSLINRLQKIQNDPDTLAKTLSSYSGDVQSLSAWCQDAKEQPLDLDYIQIAPVGAKTKKANVGFFEDIWFNARRIACSFIEDYGTVGEIYDKSEALEVWVSGGRDQLNIVKTLADNDFSTKTGINVNAALLSVDIRTAVLAGTAPDCALFFGGDMPANLALRDAVVDLTKFDTFASVKSRFADGTLTPFMIKDACYALPLSETFNMMFVRTDVFEQLDLKIPQTWDDFYEVATILQRNNLEVGIPVNIGMFATLIFQNGGDFYNEELTATKFDDDAAINAFETWTGLFSRYGFPLSYDFYNRFSSGEMPLAIVDYAQYMKIESASPELSGRWKMTLIPGVKKENGEIDRTLSICAATGADTSPGLTQSITTAMIFKASKNKEKAWDFLDWFTSDEIQADYGRQIEDTLGSISRYSSANINAFKRQAWSKAERELLLEQWKYVKLINEVAGNYSVTRETINAFRKVVYKNSNPTDTIYTYNKRINKELERKRG